LEGLERLESFGAFAGWQTAALKAHRKPLLWPGLGVPVGEVALALGCLLGKWPWPWGACWGRWGCSLCGLANGSFESLKKVIAVDLGCLLGKLFKGKGLEGLEEDKVHTCGGPRRRPGLGEGRGRRIFTDQTACAR